MNQSPATGSALSFHTFGDLLKYLRRRAHLTQLELSISVGYSESQISRLEQNQRLPDLTALKALFIPALHLEDDSPMTARLLELAQSARQEDAPTAGISPYKGLLFFDEPDSELFFGREALTAQLASHVMELAMDASTRFLAVVGASGSGKSSLVRAGLAVALKRAGWEVRIFTPTANPLKILEANLHAARTKGAERILILVDQFEEAFTLCHDEMERIAFIERLLSCAQEESKKTTAVIALRADFYSHCAQYPRLRQAVAAEQEYIGQMTCEELRRAIEEPAKRGGWDFESGLVDVLLQDIGAQGTGEPEPGALPLLSHALLATWERRRGRTLTLDGYHTSGGVRSAIAETAESVFTDQLNQFQQEMARDVFLRLTELGEGTEDTRRRAALNELVRQSTEAAQLRAVLNILAEARLITLNEDSAEVAHEALIREWQRLHEWLTTDREGLLLHRHLTESAQEWHARGRDPSDLYRGARLAQTREWAFAHQEEMNELESNFLDASITFSQREAQEREAQRQRELEATRKLAEVESQRAEVERQRAEEQIRNAEQLRKRAVYLIGALAVAIIAALTAGIFANRNATLAVQNAAIAQTAQVASTQSIADFTRSEAQRLALEATNLTLNNGDPGLIALLAIRSLNLQYTSSGDAALTNLTNLEAPPALFEGHTDAIHGVAISPNGKYLATGSQDKTVRLWDIATGQTIHVFIGHRVDVGGVAFSPDGKTLVAPSRDKTIRVWDVATGQTVKVFQASHGVDYVAFSPDGKYIAGTGLDPSARIWDVATGQTVHILTGHTGYTTRVVYSPDGQYLLTGGHDSTARLWDAVTGNQVHVLAGHTGDVVGVAFTPDSKYAATGDDHTIKLWDIATGQIVREFVGHETGFWVAGIAFTPDGKDMVSVSADGTARLWAVATGQFLHYIGNRGGVHEDVAISRDGQWLALSENGFPAVAKVWNLKNTFGGVQFIGHDGPVYQASFSPNGKFVVTSSADHSARIWDTTTGQSLITLNMNGHTDADQLRGAVFSPDSKFVLTAGADGTARLWDAATGKELRRFEGHTDVSYRAVFSPDGNYIVTARWDGTARVWDTPTGTTILIYRNQSPAHVNRVAFSPDGKFVVTSGDDGTARIWNIHNGKDLIVFKHEEGVTGVDFSSDGKFLITGSYDGTVRLWDIASGTEVRHFTGHTGWVFSTEFSHDEKYILSGGADATVRLWDLQTGQEVRRFLGHTNEVRNVTFSPDGKYILTASSDGIARLWLTDLSDTIHTICTLLPRDLTPAERIQFNISDQGPTCPVQ